MQIFDKCCKIIKGIFDKYWLQSDEKEKAIGLE